MCLYISIYQSACLSISLSVCRSVCVSIYLYICPSVCLSVYLSVNVCVSGLSRRWHDVIHISQFSPSASSQTGSRRAMIQWRHQTSGELITQSWGGVNLAVCWCIRTGSSHKSSQPSVWRHHDTCHRGCRIWPLNWVRLTPKWDKSATF